MSFADYLTQLMRRATGRKRCEISSWCRALAGLAKHTGSPDGRRPIPACGGFLPQTGIGRTSRIGSPRWTGLQDNRRTNRFSSPTASRAFWLPIGRGGRRIASAAPCWSRHRTHARRFSPPEAAGFADPPFTALPFLSLVIASSDDPFGSLDYARTKADAWGSEFMGIGARGHINEKSGLGEWPEGRAALAAFEARLR